MNEKEPIAENSEEQNEKSPESLYAQIMNMSVSEKVKLASLGSREARGLLIKDSNRIVIQAVINSPKITGDEVVSYASNKNYSKEVSKLISARKDLTKNYNVKIALVTNAKTPVPVALKLLGHIRENDLRKISKSRNVSTVIARTATKMVDERKRG
jgi:hypothetical protein